MSTSLPPNSMQAVLREWLDTEDSYPQPIRAVAPSNPMEAAHKQQERRKYLAEPELVTAFGDLA